MESTVHIHILKRTGYALLAVGLIDIAVMIYCIFNNISYSSSFNIFAVAAGIFLLRGSLRAASLVRWFSVFMLASFITLLAAWPFMQPISLTLTQVSLNPSASIGNLSLFILVSGLLLWLAKELGRSEIQAANVTTGCKQRDMRIPAAIGVLIVVFVAIFSSFLLGGESADRAKAIAIQQVGRNFNLYVNSLNTVTNSKGTFVYASVTAWNDTEIRYIPVHWVGQ
jgi:hypothetical protein